MINDRTVSLERLLISSLQTGHRRIRARTDATIVKDTVRRSSRDLSTIDRVFNVVPFSLLRRRCTNGYSMYSLGRCRHKSSSRRTVKLVRNSRNLRLGFTSIKMNAFSLGKIRFSRFKCHSMTFDRESL